MLKLTALLTAASIAAFTAQAGTIVSYSVEGAAYEGYMAEPTRESKGLVILIHDWDGVDGYEKTRAEMLADEGYHAFAVDLYGTGNRPDTTEGKKALVGRLYNDRDTMRKRILGSLEKARQISGQTDAVVMGYCFGGGATLELARSGLAKNVVGYSTFHGSLDTPEGQTYEGVTTPLLILHGGADTGIPNSLAASLADQLEASKTPYQMEIYSGAPHAWTVFGSTRYRAEADEKSWDAFLAFTEKKLSN